MDEKKVEKYLAASDKTFRGVGEVFWQTPVGMHTVKLLAVQESVTIDDIVASLEEEGSQSRKFRVMNEQVIIHLRDIQAQRK